MYLFIWFRLIWLRIGTRGMLFSSSNENDRVYKWQGI